MSKRMSRENQKLIYWFIDCYAYKLKGVDINWQTSKQKPAISDYFLYKATEDLKKLYIRHSGKNIKGYEPFRNMESKLKDRIGDIIDKNYTKESKINIITNDLMDFVTDEIQMLFIKLNDTFSLALNLLISYLTIFCRMILICGRKYTNCIDNRKTGTGCTGC